jgi:OmpA-OmpF porin, OOP family
MLQLNLTTPLRATALGAALLIGAPVAHAQMANILDESSGFYVGGGLGRADPEDADNNDAWKVYGGWQLNKWLAAELAYIDMGESGFRSSTNAGLPFSGELETWGITAHAVAQFPVPIGALDRLSVLGKLGTIYYDQESNANFPGTSSDRDGFAWAWGFGAQYTFSERLGVRAEWERFEHIDIDAWTVSLNYKF